MNIHYDPKSDILLVALTENPPFDSIEEPGGVIVSYGQDGQPVSVEFMNASSRHLLRSGEVSVTLKASSP